MNAVITIRPASTMSLATSPVRRMFSTRSAAVKPRSLLRPWRTLSPSSRYVRTPSACSSRSTMFAIVDLPLPERPVIHSTHGRCPFCARARVLVDFGRLPVDVLRAAQREVQHAGADRPVAEAVDDDEAAHVAVVGVRIERDRAIEREIAHADLVEMQRLRREVIERVDVDDVLRLAERRAERRRAELHEIRPPGSIASSLIQTMLASNWSASPAGSSAAQITSPRLMSISSASVSVIDWPSTASARSPSSVTMRATFD